MEITIKCDCGNEIKIGDKEGLKGFLPIDSFYVYLVFCDGVAMVVLVCEKCEEEFELMT